MGRSQPLVISNQLTQNSKGDHKIDSIGEERQSEDLISVTVPYTEQLVQGNIEDVFSVASSDEQVESRAIKSIVQILSTADRCDMLIYKRDTSLQRRHAWWSYSNTLIWVRRQTPWPRDLVRLNGSSRDACRGQSRTRGLVSRPRPRLRLRLRLGPRYLLLCSWLGCPGMRYRWRS